MPRGRPKGSGKKENKDYPDLKNVPEDDKPKIQSTSEQKEKLDKLKKIVNESNRNLGKSILKFASEEKVPDRIPFGNLEIDNLTGGGVPHKRFSIIWGPKSAGKSTLCYNLIREAQKKSKVCAYIDMEGTFDPNWASKMGVDLTTLLLGEGYQNAEQAMDDFINITKEGAADLIILDSVQAMSPKGEQETKKGKTKSTEDDTMALLARKLSQFFRMSASGVYNSNVAVVLVGQARTNLGGFIAFDQLSGGHALHHWSSMTLNVRRGAKSDNPVEKIKVDGKTVEQTSGFSTVIKLEKRKLASAVEGTEINIPFYFERGFQNG